MPLKTPDAEQARPDVEHVEQVARDLFQIHFEARYQDRQTAAFIGWILTASCTAAAVIYETARDYLVDNHFESGFETTSLMLFAGGLGLGTLGYTAANRASLAIDRFVHRARFMPRIPRAEKNVQPLTLDEPYPEPIRFPSHYEDIAVPEDGLSRIFPGDQEEDRVNARKIELLLQARPEWATCYILPRLNPLTRKEVDTAAKQQMVYGCQFVDDTYDDQIGQD